MKIGKIFSIDYELIEKLKQVGNQSGLVNDLLLNHFNTANTPENLAIKDKYDELVAEKKAKIEKAKERKKLIAEQRRLMEKGKITEKEFWRFVDAK